MSDPERTAPVETVRERLGVDHDHPRATNVRVAVGAVVLGWYAGWLVADFGIRLPATVVVTLLAGMGLYRQSTRAAVVATTLYALAGLVLLTPVLLELPFLLAAGRYGVADPFAFAPRSADLVVLLAFAVLSAVPAWLARRIGRSGLDDSSPD